MVLGTWKLMWFVFHLLVSAKLYAIKLGFSVFILEDSHLSQIEGLLRVLNGGTLSAPHTIISWRLSVSGQKEKCHQLASNLGQLSWNRWSFFQATGLLPSPFSPPIVWVLWKGKQLQRVRVPHLPLVLPVPACHCPQGCQAQTSCLYFCPVDPDLQVGLLSVLPVSSGLVFMSDLLCELLSSPSIRMFSRSVVLFLPKIITVFTKIIPNVFNLLISNVSVCYLWYLQSWGAV